MRETLHKIWQKIQGFWQDKTKRQKLGIVLGSLVFLILIIVLILKLSSTKFDILYGDLSLKDMGEISQKLDDMGVEWKTGSSNNSILVPIEDKNKIQIELATYGLPKEGYDLSDLISDLGWSMTDSDKKIVEKEFVESSLETTLGEMDGIRQVRVHIGDDRRSSFVLDNINNDMTASVFIVKDPKESFGNEKVRAVKHLVAGRLNMKADDVVVADNEGNLLDGNTSQSGFDVNQFAIKEDLEYKIDKNVTKLLTDIYGLGNVSVKSSVKINMNEENSKSVEYSPIEGLDSGIPRSTEEESEYYKGGIPGGIPGITENVNPEDYEYLEDQRDQHNRDKKIVNNEINEIQREIRKTPGQVDNITIAVIINQKAIPGGELTEDKKEEISNLVYAATGGDTKRVEIFSENFSSNLIDDTSSEGESKLNIKLIVLLALGLLFLGIIAFFLLRNRKEKEEKELEKIILDESSEVDDSDIPLEELKFSDQESNMKKQINRFIEERPEAVTQLLRSWLNE